MMNDHSNRFSPRDQIVLETVLSSITDFAYTFDRDGRFVFANKALLDLWGLELKDAVGKNFFDLKYPAELAAKLQRQIQQVFETKQPLSDKTAYTSPTGAKGFYEYIFTPVLTVDGSMDLVAGSTRDITEQHHTLEALRRSEERLRRVVEASGRGSWELDVSTGQVTGDARFFTLMGLPQGTPLTLESAIGALHLDDRERVRCAVSAALAGENDGRYTAEHRAGGLGDAPERWVEVSGQALFDANGKAISLAGTGVDITERKRAEQALRESEARFRQLADAVPQMVWVTRPDGYHEYYNSRWYEFTGVPLGSTDGEGWNGMFHPDDQEQAWTSWRHSLKTGEPYEIEYRLRHKSGEYRWTLGRALPIRNERGEIERWFGTCTDIDVMKRLTAEREHLLESERAARAEAEEANRAKDVFLATLSHELRTPLTAMLGWVELLLSDKLDEASARRGLEIVERSAHAQAQLVEDLLDVSRIITGKLRLRASPIDISPVVEEAVESARPLAERQRVTLKTLIGHTGTLVNADPGRVQQIVSNLLSNAIKFTPQNGNVTVELRNLDDRVEVSVADTGKGISVDFLPRIFERFSQAENTNTRTRGGLGLGLAIVRHLTELHGGSVRAQSDGEDKGSTFTITLPVTAHQDACGEFTSRTGRSVGAQAQPTAMPKLEGLKLLVVDDEVSTRELLHTLLEQCGAEVISTGSAREALVMLGQYLPGVIISDIEMPGESGYDLISKIRSLPAECGGQVPAVALSAHASIEDKERAIRTGFQRHIAKPFEMCQLVVAVSEVSKNYT